MTVSPGYEGSADAPLLEQLTGVMRVAHDFGMQADAENTNAERVIWIPKGFGSKPLRFEPADGDGIMERHRPYDVSLYASDLAGLQKLYDDLERGLYNICSWSSYELSSGDPELRTNNLGGVGFGLIAKVRIKGPLYRQVYGEGESTTVTPGLVLKNAAGQSPQAVGP